jgi:hypothetical protein
MKKSFQKYNEEFAHNYTKKIEETIAMGHTIGITTQVSPGTFVTRHGK